MGDSVLTLDIWLLIYHKLPIKDILRCKVVCKEWFGFISDPFFISNYNSSSINLFMFFPSAPKLSCLRYEINGLNEELQCVHTPLLFKETLYKVLGTWKGLVAMYSEIGVFCLFNPITKEEKLVSVSDKRMADIMSRKLAHYGLCYDQERDEYKAVMQVYPKRESDEYCLYVVSLKDGSIKSINIPKPQPWVKGPHRGIIVKGVSHWLFEFNESQARGFAYLDQGRGEIRTIALPKVCCRGEKVLGLGAFEGRLTVGIWSLGSLSLDVWSLKECGNEESWSRLFVMHNWPRGLSDILAWVSDDEVMTHVNSTPCYRIYNVRKHTWKEMKTDLNDKYGYEMATYNPSLVSPMHS